MEASSFTQFCRITCQYQVSSSSVTCCIPRGAANTVQEHARVGMLLSQIDDRLANGELLNRSGIHIA